MDIVTKIAPLALALIMLGLGLGLTVNDFKRVLQNPKIFFCRNFFSNSSFTNYCLYFTFSN